jgi:hypothetical protein
MRNVSPSPQDWRRVYFAAVLEMDPAQLTQRVNEARQAILDRIQELLTKPTSFEHTDMYNALNVLRGLSKKREGNMGEVGNPIPESRAS